MDKEKIYAILADARGTIEGQRQQIQTLMPKAEAYERIGQVLDLAMGVHTTRGWEAVQDISWSLERAMEEIHSELQAEKSRHRTASPEKASPATFVDALAQKREQTTEPDPAVGEMWDPNAAQKCANNLTSGRTGVDMSGTASETLIDRLAGSMGRTTLDSPTTDEAD